MFSPPPKRNDLTIYDRRVNAWWDHADPIFKPLRAMAPARIKLMSRALGTFDQQRILDVGCGGGYMSEAMAARGAQVVGVDIAHGALVAARAHGSGHNPPLSYLRCQADQLPFANASFDAAVCTDVLVHVPDPEEVITEIGRVLRPGGIFFFSSINRTWLSRLVMITLGEDLLRIVHRGTHDPARFIKSNEMERMCGAGGMGIAHVEGLGPRWMRWDGSLVFGWMPTRAVMYQGWAVAARS